MGSPFENPKRLRPVLKWAGGKSAVLAQIRKVFPTHFDRYLEPFLGGAAVFISFDQSRPAIVNDANPELYEFYEVLRDKPFELMEALEHLRNVYSEEHFYSLRRTIPDEPVERAARTLYLNKTGFNGLYRQNSKGEFNVPWGKRPSCPRLYRRENLLAVSEKFKTAQLHNKDFEKILELCQPGDFVYCDPPYAPVSPSANFNHYRGGGFGQEEQQRLRDAANKAVEKGAIVVISNSHVPLTGELYSQWEAFTVQAPRAINSDGQGRAAVTEMCFRRSPRSTG